MELYNGTRKSILQVISNNPSSASSVAKQVKLSLPYTLSQLAILEASGSIKKERSKEKSYGKPRLIYSIKKPYMELTILTKQVGQIFSFNGEQPLTEEYLQLLSALPKEYTSAFSEYYWTTATFRHKILATALLSTSQNTIELLSITDKEALEELRKTISHFKSAIQNKTIKIICWVHTQEEIISGIRENDEYYISILEKAKPVIDKEEVFTTIQKEASKR